MSRQLTNSCYASQFPHFNPQIFLSTRKKSRPSQAIPQSPRTCPHLQHQPPTAMQHRLAVLAALCLALFATVETVDASLGRRALRELEALLLDDLPAAPAPAPERPDYGDLPVFAFDDLKPEEPLIPIQPEPFISETPEDKGELLNFTRWGGGCSLLVRELPARSCHIYPARSNLMHQASKVL
jgi:hypothetical protein